MPFTSGQVSFGRLKVLRPARGIAGQRELDAFAAHTMCGGDIGVPREVAAGWCAGDHLDDVAFGWDRNVFDGGELVHLALRIDTNKVPADVKRSVIRRYEEQLAAGNPSGFLSRSQKAEAKDLAERELHEQLGTSRYLRSKLVPVLWCPLRGVLLTASSSNAVLERIASLWTATFDGALSIRSAGAIAGDLLEDMGRASRANDLKPTRWCKPPHEGLGEPGVPWAEASPEPLDWLGNEFLLWLWWQTERGGGTVQVEPEASAPVQVAFAMDRQVETECAWGVTGKQTLAGSLDGVSPFRLREAADALGTGKLPRKAGLILSDGAHQWSFTFQADRWLVSGCQLPQPQDEFEHARDLIEWRLHHVRRLDQLLVALFGRFLKDRSSSDWAGFTAGSMREWIAAMGDR